jgi:hypothetical protein
MNRKTSLFTLTALAVGLCAGAAFAETPAASTTVSLAGKSSDQIAADIHKAAKLVCAREFANSAYAYDLAGYCIKATAARGMKDVEKLQTAAAAKSETVASASIGR